MLFSELYSVYYKTVGEILREALQGEMTVQRMRAIVSRTAFAESGAEILSALRDGRWQLLTAEGAPLVRHAPTMPVTLLELRFLKAISEDPRMRLFGDVLPELDGIEPLFTRADYRVYDRYADGDPFEDPGYIARFRFLRDAVREGRAVRLFMQDRYGRRIHPRICPVGFEYSPKDDKIRVLSVGSKYRTCNLARILDCRYTEGGTAFMHQPIEDTPARETLILLVTDERRALERVMLHFAHFEKQAERMDDLHYRLTLRYDPGDEAELVIRTLSFGHHVKVLAPDRFVSLIRERLIKQRKLRTE